MPNRWNDLYVILVNRNPKIKIPPPLILAAWYDTPSIFKAIRFRDHLELAEKLGILDEINDFLVSMYEEEWFHFGE